MLARNMDWFPADKIATASCLFAEDFGINAGFIGMLGVVTAQSRNGFALALNANHGGSDLEGYPVLTFFARSGAGGSGAGARVALAVSHAGPSPTTVTLSVGHPAEALLVFTDIGGSDCPSIGSVLLVPPGSSESLPLRLSFTPCGGGVRVYAVGPAGSENP